MSNSENHSECRRSLFCQTTCIVCGHCRKKMLIILCDGVYLRLDFSVHCPLLSETRKAA